MIPSSHYQHNERSKISGIGSKRNASGQGGDQRQPTQQQEQQQRRRGRDPSVVGSSQTSSSCGTHSVTLVGMSSVIEHQSHKRQQESRRRTRSSWHKNANSTIGGATELTKTTTTTAETSSVEEHLEPSRKRGGMEPEGAIVLTSSSVRAGDNNENVGRSAVNAGARGSRPLPRSRRPFSSSRKPSPPSPSPSPPPPPVARSDMEDLNNEYNQYLQYQTDRSNRSRSPHDSANDSNAEGGERLDDAVQPRRSAKRKERRSGMGRAFTATSGNVKSASTGYKAPADKPDRRNRAPNKAAFPGAKFDARGNCIHHPAVKLQERKFDEWIILHEHCPLCPGGDGGRRKSGAHSNRKKDKSNDRLQDDRGGRRGSSDRNEKPRRAVDDVDAKPPPKKSGLIRSFSRSRALSRGRIRKDTAKNAGNDEEGDNNVDGNKKENLGKFKTRIKKLGGRFPGDRKKKSNAINNDKGVWDKSDGGALRKNSMEGDVDAERAESSPSASPPERSMALVISRRRPGGGRGNDPGRSRSHSFSPPRQTSFNSLEGSSCHSSISRSLYPSGNSLESSRSSGSPSFRRDDGPAGLDNEPMPTPRTFAMRGGGNGMGSGSPLMRRGSRPGGGRRRSDSPLPRPPYGGRNVSPPDGTGRRQGPPYDRMCSRSESPRGRWNPGRPARHDNNRGPSRGRPRGNYNNNNRTGPPPWQNRSRGPPNGPMMRHRSPSFDSRSPSDHSFRRRRSRNSLFDGRDSRSPESSRGSLDRSPPPFRGQRNASPPPRRNLGRSPPPRLREQRRRRSRSGSRSCASSRGSFDRSPPPRLRRRRSANSFSPSNRRGSLSPASSRGSFDRLPPQSFQGGPRRRPLQRRNSLEDDGPSRRRPLSSGPRGPRRSQSPSSPSTDFERRRQHQHHYQGRPMSNGRPTSRGRRPVSKGPPGRSRSSSPVDKRPMSQGRRPVSRGPPGGSRSPSPMDRRPISQGRRPVSRGPPGGNRSSNPVDKRPTSRGRRPVSRGPPGGSRSSSPMDRRPMTQGRLPSTGPGTIIRPGSRCQSRGTVQTPPFDDTIDPSRALVVRKRTPSPDEATMEASVDSNPQRKTSRRNTRDTTNRGSHSRGRSSSIPRNRSRSPPPRSSMGYSHPHRRRLHNGSLPPSRNSLSPSTRSRSMHSKSTRSRSPSSRRSSMQSTTQSQSLPPSEPEIWIQCKHTEEDPFENSFTTFEEWSLPPQQQSTVATTDRGGGGGGGGGGGMRVPHIGHHSPANSLPPLPPGERSDNSLERSPNSFDRSPLSTRQNSFGSRSENSLDGSPPPVESWSDHNAQTRSKASNLAKITRLITAGNGASAATTKQPPRADNRSAKPKKYEGVEGMTAADRTNVERALKIIGQGKKLPKANSSAVPQDAGGPASRPRKSKSSSILSSMLVPGGPPQRPSAKRGVGKRLSSNAATHTSKSLSSDMQKQRSGTPPPSQLRSPHGASDVDISSKSRIGRRSPPPQRQDRYDSPIDNDGPSPNGGGPALDRVTAHSQGMSASSATSQVVSRAPLVGRTSPAPQRQDRCDGAFNDSGPALNSVSARSHGLSAASATAQRPPAAKRQGRYDSPFNNIGSPSIHGSGLAQNSDPASSRSVSNASAAARGIDHALVSRERPPPPPPPQRRHQHHLPPSTEVHHPQHLHQEYELPMKKESMAGTGDEWQKHKVKNRNRHQQQNQKELQWQQRHQEEPQRQQHDDERRHQEELQRRQQQQQQHQHQSSHSAAALQQDGGGGVDQSWLNFLVDDNIRKETSSEQHQKPRSDMAGRRKSRRGSSAEPKQKMFGREPKNRAKSERENLKSVKKMPFMDHFGDNGTYTGQVNEEGRPDGKGAMKYDNGVFYEGTWTNGCQDEKAASQYGRIRGGFTSWSGKGKSATKSGMVLPWNARKNDAHDPQSKTNARGMEWTDLNGDTGRYTGEVNNDRLPHGQGIMRYNYGLIAEGEWVNGVLKEGPQDRMISAAASRGAGGMSVGPMSVGPMSVGGPGGTMPGRGASGMSVGPMSTGPMSVRSLSIGPMTAGQLHPMRSQGFPMGLPMPMPMPMMQHSMYNPNMPQGALSHAAQHAHIAQQNALMMYGGAAPMMPQHPMQMQMPMPLHPQVQQPPQIPHPSMPGVPQTKPDRPPVSEIKFGN